MAENDSKEAGLDYLLDLDGFTAEVGGGYWVTMRAKRVPRNGERPHGIQYALSLHTPKGERILGYDNAHRSPARSGPAGKSAQPLAFDHMHKGGRMRPYKFTSPEKLLIDFWADVEAILDEEDLK